MDRNITSKDKLEFKEGSSVEFELFNGLWLVTAGCRSQACYAESSRFGMQKPQSYIHADSGIYSAEGTKYRVSTPDRLIDINNHLRLEKK